MNILLQQHINKLNGFRQGRQKGSEGVYNRSLHNYEIKETVEELEYLEDESNL